MTDLVTNRDAKIPTNDNTSVAHPRAIKSFVVRSGRMTLGQEKAYEQLWALYGVEADEQVLDFKQLFLANESPSSGQMILEIGFGMGDSLLAMAQSHEQNNYLGIEVHKPGVGRVLANIDQHSLNNLKVMRADAVDVLKTQIADNSLDAVYLFFPDPWHKTRHQKRRIVQDDFVQLIRKKLAVNGQFHMATDWQHYAKQMLRIMKSADGFANIADNGEYVPRPEYRPITKFERRGERLGHGVWDIIFKKTV